MLGLTGIILLLASVAPGAPRGVDFQRQVRPILSNACFHCHGPDAKTRMADLRLDTREGAFSSRKSGVVIVPGKPDASLLMQRVLHANGALRMPPAHTKKELSEAQKQTLRQWIADGAEWKEHWSFSAPVKHEAPVVKNTAWVRNGLDRFILAKLEQEGLTPAPEADRRALIRRVTLDLTGLPPVPADVEAFVNDRSANAYEKVVDRLLASPQWGEHRGRYWLDAARYADTHGLHIDNYREMWAYRDWVINAFNRNLRFDQFTLEQLAGDLLPQRTLDQQIASGFNRCNITTNEGGSIPEEVDAIYQKDRVETTSTVWMGLTTGCATCHDHKFDPIAQKEFYQMVAFFKNTVQKPMDGNIPDTPPVIVVPRAEDTERWMDTTAKETELKARSEARRKVAQQGLDAWIATGEHKSWKEPVAAAALPLALAPAKGVTAGKGPAQEPEALHFGEKAALTVPDVPEFDPSKPFTFAAWVYMPGSEDAVVIASHTDARNQARGWLLDTSGRIPRFLFTVPGQAEKVQLRGSNVQRIKVNAWTHVAVTYDGSKESAGATMYLNGRALDSSRVPRDPEEEMKTGDPARMALRLGSDGKRYFKGGALAGVRIYREALSPDEVQLLSRWKRGEEPDRQSLLLMYLNRKDAEYKQVRAALDEVELERRAIRRRGTITHVMQEKGDTKPSAHILYRGMYDQPRDEVFADVPSVLPPMRKDLPRNRLGLAQWLIDPAHPLMARVTVNRFWQEVFGTGLVKTAEDFGSQGEAPVHPELLDTLAVEFRESGWDVKAFYKMMVMSGTYRQSAQATREKLKKDPENRWLSRGPRYRMDAEMVRDSALAASGLLTRKIGGPSVRPYQPEGIWETVAMKGSDTRFYKQDKGDALYRRSMYTFWKRSAPPASMEIFNAPTRENCTVRRERTNTPLQALVTMNDVQYVEAARSLAQRVIREAGKSFDQRLDLLTAYVLSRPFDAGERQIARASFDDFRKHYHEDAPAAVRLTGMGESKPDGSLPVDEFAAWTLLANQVLNLDEALNK
ncbi:MAG: DUF1553 domain-containing protein [Acidobacteria bacterium]|nr:DUF1553 domain-containing protein [Acidobacteriota bacterium]